MVEASKTEEADRELAERVAAAQGGDRAALQALLLGVQPRVRNLVRYLLRGDDHVDEVAQDALVAIVRGLPTYRSEGTFQSWADRVTARVAFVYIRRLAKERDRPRGALYAVTEPHARIRDPYLERRDLVRALDALPREQRDALVLHHIVGMTVPEIAEELSTKHETVRSRLRLGVQRVRAIMSTGKGDAS